MPAPPSRPRVRRGYARAESEKAFQTKVELLAKYNGWLTYHTFDSRRSQPGFPDLVLVRGRRIVVAELKAEKGRVSDEQQKWLAALEEVAAAIASAVDRAQRGGHGPLYNGEPRLTVAVWRPSDWTTIEETLKR